MKTDKRLLIETLILEVIYLEKKLGLFLIFFLLPNEFYYIYRYTMIITNKFYSISIPNPQCIPLPPNLSHLETVFFKVCEAVYILEGNSLCPFFRFRM